MILLDQPYVSGFLKETIQRNRFPVFEPSGPLHFQPGMHEFCLDEQQAIRHLESCRDIRLYTNSENSIGWISRNLGFTGLPGIIKLFKDKAAFRRLTRSLYPWLFFKEVACDDIGQLDITGFPFPFVIKPSIGFFSLGVYTVNHAAGWEQVKIQLQQDIQKIRSLYPSEVLNTTNFIIEQYIEGEEFAFDAYYDEAGKPVILNILKHYFASPEDVSDRVYVTSAPIMREYLPGMTAFLESLGKLVSMKNFPLHVEIRIDEAGSMVPIEVNPLRFGGWCTTADTTWHAYRINSYEYFLNNRKPDWDRILSEKDDSLYSLIVLNNSTGVEGRNIRSFDHEALLQHFHHPLEFRTADFKAFPLFGFLFTETPAMKQEELEWILKNDLKEFISLQ